MLKKVIASLMVVCLVVATSFMVMAADFPSEVRPGSGAASELEGAVGNVWATVAFVVQTLSIGCVVVLGIRYMFASADKRADIKGGLTMVVLGAIFVFSAATVARFIVDAGSDIL